MDSLERSASITNNEAASLPAEQREPPTILVIDDDSENLRMMSEILQEAGIEVVMAHRGEQALQLLEDTAADLILLDLTIPGLSGLETCRRLQAQPHTQNIPVIFMVALTDVENITAVFKAGGRDYITKPFFQQELLARVTTNLNVQNLQNHLKARNAELRQHISDLEVTKQALQQAHKELENQLAYISAMALVARMMSSTLDIDTVLNQVIDVARQLLAAEAVAVLLHAPKQDNLYFAAASSPGSDELIGKAVPLENSIAGWCFRHNEAVVVPDAASDPRFFRGIDQATGLVTQSLLAVPLVHRQHKIGVLEASNKARGSFNQEDIRRLEPLAYSASSAIANARLFEQIQQGREQLRNLARAVVNAQEDERQRLSYELHDDVGQNLTALKLTLEMLQGDLPDNCAFLERRISSAVELTISLTQRLHTLARNLRPAALYVTGLHGALEDHCAEFAGQVGIEIVYRGQELRTASDQAELLLYRCVQEALNNVVKHAQASRATVTLESLPNFIKLSVGDNGVGFDVDAAMDQSRSQGIGLLGVRERLEPLGGRLELVSQPGQGTTFIIYLPVEG